MKQNLFLDHSDIGFIHNKIGIAYWQTDQLERALESLNKALNIFKKSNDENSGHRIAACYTNIALIWKQEKKYEEALNYL
jgi:tetratricopeptide (TPR) repeat protein